jgi:hypothetical protein
MWALVSVEGYSFVFAFATFVNIEHFIIYVLLCNLRTHIITLYSGHVCDVLWVIASVMATRDSPG